MLAQSSQVSSLVKPQVQSSVGFDSSFSFIKKFGNPSAAYSLRDLNDAEGNNKIVRVRRGYAQERDFSAKEVSNGTLEDWVGSRPPAQTITAFQVFGINHYEGNSILNGDYVADGTSNGKTKWKTTNSSGDVVIQWSDPPTRIYTNEGARWEFIWSGSSIPIPLFRSNEDTTYPWQVTTWTPLTANTGTPNFYFDTDGFVSVWYDQSGNSNHAFQPEIWLQPRIVVSGSLVKDSRNNPAIEFANDAMDLTNDLVASGAYSCIAYHELINSTMLLRGIQTQPRVRAANNGYQINTKTFPVASTQGLVSVIKDSSHNARVYASGTESSGGQKNVGSISSSQFKKLCTNYGFGGGKGKLIEFIYYPSDESANRPTIEANINNKYGIN